MTPSLLGYFISLVIVILLALIFIDQFSSNKFFCNTMGWHKSPSEITNDGSSNNGKCPRCGKDVLQDSQGDWF